MHNQKQLGDQEEEYQGDEGLEYENQQEYPQDNGEYDQQQDLDQQQYYDPQQDEEEEDQQYQGNYQNLQNYQLGEDGQYYPSEAGYYDQNQYYQQQEGQFYDGADNMPHYQDEHGQQQYYNGVNQQFYQPDENGQYYEQENQQQFYQEGQEQYDPQDQQFFDQQQEFFSQLTPLEQQQYLQQQHLYYQQLNQQLYQQEEDEEQGDTEQQYPSQFTQQQLKQFQQQQQQQVYSSSTNQQKSYQNTNQMDINSQINEEEEAQENDEQQNNVLDIQTQSSQEMQNQYQEDDQLQYLNNLSRLYSQIQELLENRYNNDLNDLFQFFDINNRGNILFQDLKQVIDENFDDNLLENEMILFKFLDQDCDQKINIQDWYMGFEYLNRYFSQLKLNPDEQYEQLEQNNVQEVPEVIPETQQIQSQQNSQNLNDKIESLVQKWENSKVFQAADDQPIKNNLTQSEKFGSLNESKNLLSIKHNEQLKSFDPTSERITFEKYVKQKEQQLKEESPKYQSNNVEQIKSSNHQEAGQQQSSFNNHFLKQDNRLELNNLKKQQQLAQQQQLKQEYNVNNKEPEEELAQEDDIHQENLIQQEHRVPVPYAQNIDENKFSASLKNQNNPNQYNKQQADLFFNIEQLQSDSHQNRHDYLNGIIHNFDAYDNLNNNNLSHISGNNNNNNANNLNISNNNGSNLNKNIYNTISELSSDAQPQERVKRAGRHKSPHENQQIIREIAASSSQPHHHSYSNSINLRKTFLDKPQTQLINLGLFGTSNATNLNTSYHKNNNSGFNYQLETSFKKEGQNEETLLNKQNQLYQKNNLDRLYQNNQPNDNLFNNTSSSNFYNIFNNNNSSNYYNGNTIDFLNKSKNFGGIRKRTESLHSLFNNNDRYSHKLYPTKNYNLLNSSSTGNNAASPNSFSNNFLNYQYNSGNNYNSEKVIKTVSEKRTDFFDYMNYLGYQKDPSHSKKNQVKNVSVYSDKLMPTSLQSSQYTSTLHDYPLKFNREITYLSNNDYRLSNSRTLITLQSSQSPERKSNIKKSLNLNSQEKSFNYEYKTSFLSPKSSQINRFQLGKQFDVLANNHLNSSNSNVKNLRISEGISKNKFNQHKFAETFNPIQSSLNSFDAKKSRININDSFQQNKVLQRQQKLFTQNIQLREKDTNVQNFRESGRNYLLKDNKKVENISDRIKSLWQQSNSYKR